MNQTKTNYGALTTIAVVFFFWGFVAASNDILIPVFKNHLKLEQWQSQLISFAFYIAYTVGSILYIFISYLLKKDILNKIGYKNGVSLGLLISAMGTLLFIPAANNASFYTMITGLFIVGLGFSLQQTAANPLTINMGDPASGSQRLSLTGGINNLGTTIGPVILGAVIFGSSTSSSNADIKSIQIPYLVLGLAFVVAAVFFKFSKIPNQLSSSEDNSNEAAVKFSVARYPQLWMGMIAIFTYVGVEVATAGNLSDLLQKEFHVQTNKVAPYVSLFWGSLMIGRWTSAAGAFSISQTSKTILGFILPFVAFAIFLGVNALNKQDVSNFYFYAFAIILLIVADKLSKGNPATQLLLFSALGILSLLVGIYTTGTISIYAFIAVGLFCSTLWPCIFTLAISGLGSYTNKGSGFLIMMIMGGGIISLLQGYLASEELLGIRNSFYVGIACFAYLFFYAYKVSSILRKQGIDFDQKQAGGH